MGLREFGSGVVVRTTVSLTRSRAVAGGGRKGRRNCHPPDTPQAKDTKRGPCVPLGIISPRAATHGR